MEIKGKNLYVAPHIEIVAMECEQLLALSGGNASVGGWGDGGSLGGGDAEEEESLSRRGTWGDLWSDNCRSIRKCNY